MSHGPAALVVSCEHAAWALPAGVDLGVPAELLQTQAGWDHGALDIARALADRLGAPLHAGRYTRTWVDLNRPPTHPDVVPARCYGLDVPGNVALDDGARDARIARDHAPYWAAVRADVLAALARAGACLHLSSHSFSPDLDPARRQFDVGVLYDPAAAFERGLAEQMMATLAAAGLRVRANEPYGGTGPALTTELRRELWPASRYAGIELETSHAVTEAPGGTARVSAALIDAVAACLAGR
jgi:predicted N-formylglutamate amidohydrolase